MNTSKIKQQRITKLLISLIFIYVVADFIFEYIHNQYIHEFIHKSRFVEWEVAFIIGEQILVAVPLIFAFIQFYKRDTEQTRRHLLEIMESESRHRMLMDALPDFVLIESQGKVQYINDAAAQLLRVSSKEELIGRPATDSIFAAPSPNREPVVGQTSGTELHRVTGRDGIEIEVEYSSQPINYNGFDAILYIGRDITERNKKYNELAITRAQLHNILNSIDTGIWSYDVKEDKMLFVSEAYKKMFGIPSEENDISPDRWRELALPEDLPAFDESFARISETNLFIYDFRYYKPDGSIGYIQTRIVPVKDDEGTVVRLDGVNIDITKRVSDQKRIEFLAYHDELTGLPNRRMFRQRLKEAATNATKHNEKFGVVYLDMDKFKNINDTMGHYAGDLFLISVGARLLGEFDQTQHTVARMGGDEFTLIVNGIKSGDHLKDMIARIEKLFHEPFLLDGVDFIVTASIGISVYPDDGTDVDMLMNYADHAMFLAKESRNGHKYHNLQESTLDIERYHLQNGLQKALENDEFSVFYQPKYNISDSRLIGAEALIRWKHPKLGQVSPAKFIPIAEEFGLIKSIGEWVLEQVCKQIAVWQNLGYRFPVSVNLSVKQFREETIVQTIRSMIERSGIDPGLLELEITEGMAMDIEKALRILQELRKIGLRISVDDFGTGYSSLNYLKKLPIHQLKVDKSFIDDITRDLGDAAIVSTIVTLAHNLNLKVIAEGVENMEQLEKLREIGCDEVQGYLFNKPLPLAEFDEILYQNFGK
ncbi:EAL domain-containing protein [Paenibacillus alginolyticus]|uniref:EAL domain-containing protein n=1 Tax=Paenibacillus alginolyticus TaxID=59839 RepID=A0ABT4GCL3_9BACL|nr:EAL domain-containing protein [Paenibacillus alginolyticus]MCY9693931.1 EAL domain-containing protein [Paenibacillus alginolyticus]MEC0146852.1 EAL domain-containing protein [Paenibacillus alginolyticus]